MSATTVNVFPGMGAFSELAGSGVIPNTAAGEYQEVVVTHAEFLQLGDLQVTPTSPFVATIIAHHRATQFTVRFTNESSYAAAGTYTWARTGRLMQDGW